MNTFWHRTALIVLLLSGSTLAVTGQGARVDQDLACRTLLPASAGGAMPKSQDLMVLRYLGTSNYEIDYRGKVLLLDAFYDGQRGPQTRLIGFKADDVKQVNAIFIGHPHIDHIADAPTLAKRLNVPVFVAPAGRPVLEREQVPSNLIKYVSGGESIKMNGYTVSTALAQHSALDPKVVGKYAEAAMTVAPMTPEDLTYFKHVLAYNPPSEDPNIDIPSHGTIAYVFAFDDGFKVAFRDSPGAVTEGERAMVKQLGGSVDVAIVGYNGFGVKSVVDVTVNLAKLYQPKLFLPAHQDAYIGGVADFSTAPLFLALRDELPQTRTLEPLYRTPICINTKTKAVSYDQWVTSGK